MSKLYIDNPIYRNAMRQFDLIILVILSLIASTRSLLSLSVLLSLLSLNMHSTAVSLSSPSHTTLLLTNWCGALLHNNYVSHTHTRNTIHSTNVNLTQPLHAHLAAGVESPVFAIASECFLTFLFVEHKCGFHVNYCLESMQTREGEGEDDRGRGENWHSARALRCARGIMISSSVF